MQTSVKIPSAYMRSINCLIYILCVFSSNLLSQEVDYTRSRTSVTLEIIDVMYINNLTFVDTNIKTICQYLTTESKKSDPDGKGIFFTIEPQNDLRFNEFVITIRMEKTSISGVIEVLTQKAPIKYGIIDDIVFFKINEEQYERFREFKKQNNRSIGK